MCIRDRNHINSFYMQINYVRYDYCCKASKQKNRHQLQYIGIRNLLLKIVFFGARIFDPVNWNLRLQLVRRRKRVISVVWCENPMLAELLRSGWGFQFEALGKFRSAEVTWENKKPRRLTVWAYVFGCGDRIWTCDLRVMSPTSCQTAPPRVWGMTIAHMQKIPAWIA